MAMIHQWHTSQLMRLPWGHASSIFFLYTAHCKIAIVYSQPREAQEYRDYIAYLPAAGELTGEVETLVLEDLPGAQGLRALRVTVAMQLPNRAPCDHTGESLETAWSALRAV
jgi:hypothetical protein